MCGAKTVAAGAFVSSCSVGVKNVEGWRVGGGNKVGKPPAIVLFRDEEKTHPAVIELKACGLLVLEKVEVQLCTSPGTFPETAVTCDPITKPNHALAGVTKNLMHETGFIIRAPSETEARPNGPVKTTFIPAFRRNESYRPGLINDRRARQWRAGNRRAGD